MNIKESYLAITSQAAECIVEQIGKTYVGRFGVNKRNLEAMFADGKPHPVTSSTLEMQIFRDKLGANKPLNIELRYKDMKIEFKRSTSAYDYNVKLRFMLMVAVFHDFEDPEHMHLNLPTDELFYDELPFVVEGLTYNLADVMYNTLLKWRIDYKHGTKHYPHRNSMQMTPNDYLLFLNQFTTELKKDQTIINARLREGVKYPLSVPEFKTNLTFDDSILYQIFTQREYTQ